MNNTKLQNIIEKSLANGLDYTQYKDLIESLLKENKVTGHTQSEDLVKYTELNLHRIHRWDKKIELNAEIKETLNNLSKDYLWLCIAEGWCGDASHLVPIINKVAEASMHIELKIVLRDDNDELMQEFLTNGGKAIPKLIILDKQTLEIENTWGPRPKPAADLIINYKKEHGKIDAIAKENLQKWYNSDKGQTTIQELISLVK